MVAHACTTATGEAKTGELIEASPGKKLGRSYLKNKPGSQAPVAHPCNPGCSGGRDQEDRISKLRP
jgi:hypothetical protein